MNTEHEQAAPEEGNTQPAVQQQQQQQPETSEGHGGQGSDSAMKQMRVWEQRRASNSGGKRRSGPN
ncbi:MAG TPA: hypothetical protein VF522_00095 [Ramlibacter sp.]|uniref:hypothetical protein n=1 Tax=Ramlibacter sp. TaxID=1917967 RepID=UPI002ED3332A